MEGKEIVQQQALKQNQEYSIRIQIVGLFSQFLSTAGRWARAFGHQRKRHRNAEGLRGGLDGSKIRPLIDVTVTSSSLPKQAKIK